MTSSSERIDALRVKVDRAEKLLEELGELDSMFSTVNCSLQLEQKDGVAFYSINLPFPPAEVSALVGDCIHNIRSSLDHLVWMIVESTNRSRPSNSNMFPICDTEIQFADQLKRNRLRGVPQRAIECIRGVQPFLSGRYELALLNSLCVQDKHRHLLYSTSIASDLELVWIRNSVHVLTTVLGNDEVRNGEIFGGVGFDPTLLESGTVEVLGKANAYIAFRDETANHEDSLPLVQTMLGIIEYTKHDVIAPLLMYLEGREETQ